MILTEIAGICRCCFYRASIAYPDTLAASDALTDDLNRPFVGHANGFGRAYTDA
jgi:hypothetical protein